MFQTSKVFIFSVLSLCVLQSCVKDGEFPNEPNIEFLDFEVFGTVTSIDSAVFSFSFTDGDGDIGAEDSTDFNCFLIYEEKNNDTITTFPSIENRSYSLPSLTPKAKDKSIEGDVSLTIKPAPIYNITTDSAFRYSCYIIDRAGNTSNMISGPWQLKP